MLYNEMLYDGLTVYVTTKTYQKRKHHKKRINKKWLKRYGCYEIDFMPHNQIIKVDNKIYMTKKTFEELEKNAITIYN